MSCIGTYGENCKSDNLSKYRVFLVAFLLLWHEKIDIMEKDSKSNQISILFLIFQKLQTPTEIVDVLSTLYGILSNPILTIISCLQRHR